MFDQTLLVEHLYWDKGTGTSKNNAVQEVNLQNGKDKDKHKAAPNHKSQITKHKAQSTKHKAQSTGAGSSTSKRQKART